MSAYNIVKSKEMGEGKGAKVKRVFPTRNYPGHHDPFVLLDEFTVESPASFPDHEHRGFEAVTYMIKGSFIHEDNLGNKSEVKTGGIQVFNAGKSLIHSEKPGDTGHSHGIQLWINLPEKLKKSNPNYQQLDQVKVIKDEDDITVRKLLGNGINIELKTDVSYYDIELKDDVHYNHEIDEKHKGLLYLIKGSVDINNLKADLSQGEALLFDKLDNIDITALSDARFIILTGKPLDQKIKIKGSFVE